MSTETKYTAEQMEAAAASVNAAWCKTDPLIRADRCQLAAAMLRHAAQMMREREVGGAVTNEDVQVAVQAFATSLLSQREKGGTAHHHDMRAALESFAAPRAAVPDALLQHVDDIILVAKVLDADKVPLFSDLINARNAMLAAAPRAAVPDGWRPMSDCPRDEDVIFWNHDHREFFKGYKPMDAMNDEDVISGFTASVAHLWMPIPTAAASEVPA